MNQIDIANAILENRKKKKITQEELATFIGVSKAAVSKWETGQSYPDVVLLPQLAAYFNISIDELMRYTPQMTKEEIRSTYLELRECFGKEPFETAYEKWELIVRKYYACFPLLYQMGMLLINYSVSIEEPEKKKGILLEAKALFCKIETEAKEAELINSAMQGKAVCSLLGGDPIEVIDILEHKNKLLISNEIILAEAYAMTGNVERAKSEIQTKLFQYILAVINNMQCMISLCVDNEERFLESVKRTMEIIELFDIENLNAGVVLPVYLCAARGFIIHNKLPEALDQLRHYVEAVTEKTFPLEIHGDAYFDQIDEFLKECELGGDAPRDENTVKKDCISQIFRPEFEALNEMELFQHLKSKLLTL